MDRYEYNVKSDQIKKLYGKKDYATMAEIADTIDWTRVKSNSMLTMVADAYEGSRQFDKARDVLEIAYDRAPLGRQIAYRLTILSIRMKDFVAADEYYQDFVEIAPRDVAQYILKYRLARAKGEDISSLISILEAYVDVEMDERWQYELAKLYHENGQKDECIAMCDKIILWFAEGKYVTKAMELKMQYEPLTEEQQAKYDGKWDYYNEKIKAEAAANNEKYGITDDDSEDKESEGEESDAEDSNTENADSQQGEQVEEDDVNESVEPGEGLQQNSAETESENGTQNTTDTVLDETSEHKEEKPWDNMEDIINDTTALDYLTDYTEEEKLNIEEEPEDNSDETAAAVEEQLAKMVSESMEDAMNEFGSSNSEETMEEQADVDTQEEADVQETADNLSAVSEDEDDYLEDEEVEDFPEETGDNADIDDSEVRDTEAEPETSETDIFETPENAYIKPILDDEEEDIEDMDDTELMAKSVSDEDFLDDTIDEFDEDESYLEDDEEDEDEDEEENTADEDVSEEADNISEDGDNAVEKHSISEDGIKENNDKIEIFEFNESSDSSARKIGEELTKTAEIDIDEINFKVKQYDESLYNTANIQAALAQSMKLIMRAESEKATRNAFAESDTMDEPTKRIDSVEKKENEQPEEIHSKPVYETVPLQPIYNKAEDGQIYLLQPEEEDQQVEGQMDFEDVLKELENRKKEALEEATRKEEIAIEAARRAAREAVAAKEAVARAIAEEAAAREALEKAAESGAEVISQIPVEDEGQIPENATILEIDNSTLQTEPVETVPEVAASLATDTFAEAVKAPVSDALGESVKAPLTDVPGESVSTPAADILGETVSTPAADAFAEPASASAASLVTDTFAEPVTSTATDMFTEPASAPAADVFAETVSDSETFTESDTVSETVEEAATEAEEEQEEGKKLSDENKRIFADFLETKGMENDIATVLENLIDGFVKDGTSRTNNLIVTGDAKTGKTSLALGIIKVANQGRGRNGRRVAKVKATVLNKKGITAAMSQIMGTDLVIEQAGNLMPGTVVDMVAAMKLYTDEMIIVLEDDKAAIERLIETNPIIKEMFNNMLSIQEYTIDDYVKVAKQYAQEQNYVIDEMGTLALFAKIDDISGRNQGITKEEIEEIIDDAIVHADRFKFSKIIGKIKRTRYEMGVLKEEDFE